jgi:uncharacterized protein (TIGR02301 family)
MARQVSPAAIIRLYFFGKELVMKFSCLIIATVLMSVGAAAAQDLESYQQRQRDLAALAELFGEMHHIRRTCEPRFEADVWRERMKQMIDLEEPQTEEREALVQQFNKGYRGAQARFPVCDRRARDYAAGRAAQGDAVVQRLSEALREEDLTVASPYLITPPEPQQP